jgi:hypothetical protein
MNAISQHWQPTPVTSIGNKRGHQTLATNDGIKRHQPESVFNAGNQRRHTPVSNNGNKRRQPTWAANVVSQHW